MRCGGRGRRRGWGSGATASIYDDARDLIGAVEIRVAGLVAGHQAVELAFADAVAGINLVRQQIGGGFGAGLGLARLREQGVERADFRVEVSEVGGGQGASGGECGEVGGAGVVDGGAVGQAVGFGLVQQVGGAEIHGVEHVMFALRFRPLRDGAPDDGGDFAHGLPGDAFVFGEAGGDAGLFEFFGADFRNGGGEGSARAGKGHDGDPEGFEVVQNTQHGDEHLGMSLLSYIHSLFGW